MLDASRLSAKVLEYELQAAHMAELIPPGFEPPPLLSAFVQQAIFRGVALTLAELALEVGEAA